MYKNYSKMHSNIKKYISSWEKRGYANGIPDEAPAELESALKVPSYRMICKAILKNDIHLQSLGYSRPECELYNKLKRIELGIPERIDVQLDLGVDR
jgi:predicted phosphoadenosine phosphosulfate sulfurtransferase